MAKASISKPTSPTNQYRNKWFYINDFRARLLLVLTCVVCYGNTIFNSFSLDDDFAVTQNSYVQKGISGIPDLLTHPYITTGDKTMDYRPISGISFAIEHQFFGQNPHVSHLVNILLFIACVLLLFKVLKDVFGLQKYHSLLPLIICLFYTVHPAHTEVVASIKSRDELLSFIFSLLAFLHVFYFFTVPTKSLGYGIKAVIFFLLSFLSKLVAMPLIPILILTGIFFGYYKQKIKFYPFFAILLTVAISYMFFMVSFLKRTNYDIENPLFYNHDFSIRLGTTLQTLFFYFKFMFVPYPFRFYYGYNIIPMVSMGDSTAVLSLFVHLLFWGYGAWLFFRKEILGLIILCYPLSIVLFSNFFGTYPGIVAERVLFSPSVWFIAAFIFIFFKVGKFEKLKEPFSLLQKSILALGILVFFSYTWMTIQRNFQWKNMFTLMAADIDHLNNSTLANYFYGSALQGEGEMTSSDSLRNYYFQQAKKYYRRSIHVSPAYSEPYFKIGMIFEYEEQNYDSAFEYFSKAYPLDTSKTTAEFQLAKSYYLKNDFTESNKLLTELYSKMPEDTFTLFFYCRVKYALGDTTKALAINDQLMQLAPTSYYAYWNKALFYHQSGRFAQAVPYYESAFKYGYRDRGIINLVINYYSGLGQNDKAAEIRKYISG